MVCVRSKRICLCDTHNIAVLCLEIVQRHWNVCAWYIFFGSFSSLVVIFSVPAFILRAGFHCVERSSVCLIWAECVLNDYDGLELLFQGKFVDDFYDTEPWWESNACLRLHLEYGVAMILCLRIVRFRLVGGVAATTAQPTLVTERSRAQTINSLNVLWERFWSDFKHLSSMFLYKQMPCMHALFYVVWCTRNATTMICASIQLHSLWAKQKTTKLYRICFVVVGWLCFFHSYSRFIIIIGFVAAYGMSNPMWPLPFVTNYQWDLRARTHTHRCWTLRRVYIIVFPNETHRMPLLKIIRSDNGGSSTLTKRTLRTQHWKRNKKKQAKTRD